MKLLIKELDYISPSITFYYNSQLSHSSIISGILSIISILFIITYTFYFFFDFINHKNPDAFYYNSFIEDAGFFPINSSSIFHFINLRDNNNNNPGEKGFDFQMFRAIGIDKQFEGFYLNSKTIKNMDHWLYGKCNNDSDTKGISHLIDKEFFKESACIRKFYNQQEDKYYDVNEPNFRWPNLSHGNYNPNETFYNVVIEKCEEDTLQIMFGNNQHCKNEKEIEEYFSTTHNIFFNFIDHSVDMLNFLEPNKKFIYRTYKLLEKNKYYINHLNFNPSMIKTHKGFVFEQIEEELSYVYDRNDVIQNPIDKKKIYMVYRLWMNNRLQHYERFYKRWQNAIADIGGIAEFINFVAIFLSYLYNNYIIIADTEVLLSSFNNNYENKNTTKINVKFDIKKNNKMNIENNSSNNSDIKIQKIRHKSKKNDTFNIIENKERDKIKSNSLNIIISDDNSKNQKRTKYDYNTNFTYNKTEELKTNQEREEVKNSNQISEQKIEKINFFKYLIYKIFCKKKYENIKVYEDFREKVMSEKQLYLNYFYINQLKMIKQEK